MILKFILGHDTWLKWKSCCRENSERGDWWECFNVRPGRITLFL